jgi:hypothetical protein
VVVGPAVASKLSLQTQPASTAMAGLVFAMPAVACCREPLILRRSTVS